MYGKMRNLRYNYFCKIEIGFKTTAINFNNSAFFEIASSVYIIVLLETFVEAKALNKSLYIKHCKI